jgi:excisionase family DNA binding protein
MSSAPQIPVLNNFITVKSAETHSGYSNQYLRRLLRSGKLQGVKIGQMWLIEMQSLESYIHQQNKASERRCGPR